MSTILMQDYNNRLDYLNALKSQQSTNQEIERQRVLENSLNDFRVSLPDATLNEAVLPKYNFEKYIKDFMTSPYYTGDTYSNVLCKDGTTKTQRNNPNERILDACRDNGGRAETFIKVICNDGSIQNIGSNPSGARVDVPCKNNGGVSKNQESVNRKGKDQTITEKTFLQKNKTILLIVGALVLSYFAYKKFNN